MTAREVCTSCDHTIARRPGGGPRAGPPIQHRPAPAGLPLWPVLDPAAPSEPAAPAAPCYPLVPHPEQAGLLGGDDVGIVRGKCGGGLQISQGVVPPTGPLQG